MAYPKKKPPYNPEYTQKQEEELNNFLFERGQHIIKMLKEDNPERMIWNNPIFNIRFTNPASGVRYNNYNTMLLASQMQTRKTGDEEIFPFFMTYKQAQDNGLQVRAKSVGYGIIKKFGKKINEFKVVDQETNEEKTKEIYKSSRSRASVFNISDMDGELSEKMQSYMDFGKKPLSPEEVEVILTALIETSPVSVERKYLGERQTCYYSPTTDKINLAPRSTFNSSIEEVSTLAHEITHAYGDERRENRPCAKLYHTNDKFRAEEELIANLSALAIVNHFGLTSTEKEKEEAFLKNHDAYDVGWASHLKETPKVIFDSAEAADKTAGKIIEAIEANLSLKLKDNPDLAISDVIKERLLNRDKKIEPKAEYKKTSGYRKPRVA